MIIRDGRKYKLWCIAKLILPAVLFINHALAQGVVATSEADTNKIRIGEQFHLNLTAVIPPGTKVYFPLFPDTFNHFEVIERGKIDTVSGQNQNSMTLKQQVTLTSFDSGYYVVPPMPFLVRQAGKNDDTIMTEAALMTVVTVPVDTTKDIRPIKPVMEVPFPWIDYLIYVFLFFLVTGIIYVVYKKLTKKKLFVPVKPVVKRPPHEIALEKLHLTEEQKLWQQGLIKKYYSEVTDTLRQYIEDRFGVYAMEQTTDEILRHFENDLVRPEDKEKLKYVLRLADMVKFAKAITIPSENETSMQYAYDFVNDTRPVVKEDFEKEAVK